MEWCQIKISVFIEILHITGKLTHSGTETGIFWDNLVNIIAAEPSPSHQLPQYWICRMNGSRSSMWKGFKYWYLCYLSAKWWLKMHLYLYVFLNKSSMKRFKWKYQLIGLWEIWLWYKISNFQTPIKHRYLEHFFFFCEIAPQVNAKRSHWWSVIFGSGNGLVPSGKMLLLDPMLTQI